jgi:transcriptional regulator with XRE-family HTH domain
MNTEQKKERMKKSDAVSILHRRYVGDDAGRKTAIEAERINAQIARTIYELRRDAGLTQEELATAIGTTQSVISRVEDSDYEGHSLSMLKRVAKALNQKLTVSMTAREPEVSVFRLAFQVLFEKLRKSRGLSLDALAEETGLDRNELLAIERSGGYRPSPRCLDRLARFYDIPHRRLAYLAGALQDVPQEFAESASRFAAQSDSFGKLTSEEQAALDEFVKALKVEL